jgi:hypothetical protein
MAASLKMTEAVVPCNLVESCWCYRIEDLVDKYHFSGKEITWDACAVMFLSHYLIMLLTGKVFLDSFNKNFLKHLTSF